MDKNKVRRVAIFTIIIWLASCSRLPAPASIPYTKNPEATPSALPTKQVVILNPTQKPTQTLVLTSVPSEAPTLAPFGNVVVWAPMRIKDLLDQPGLMKGFNKRYPGIDLQWEVKDSSQIEQDIFRSEVTTQPPDIIFLEGDQAASFAASGTLAEITSSSPDGNNSGTPAASIEISLENRVFGQALYTEPIVVYYRRDVFEKAGLATNPSAVSKLIPTWQSLLSICQIIHTKTGYPCFDLNRANNSGNLFEIMLQTHDFGYFDETGKVRVSSDVLTPVLSDCSRFWKAGIVGDELAWTPAWLNHLSSVENPVALVFGTPALGKALETWISPESVGKWGIVPVPSYKQDPPTMARDSGGYLVISAESKNQAASLEVIRFFTQDPSVQVVLLEEKEYFPAFIDLDDLSKVGQPDPFFAGQIPAEVFFSSSNFPKWPLFGPGYREIHASIVTAVRRVAIGQLNPEEAIAQFLEKVYSSPSPKP